MIVDVVDTKTMVSVTARTVSKLKVRVLSICFAADGAFMAVLSIFFILPGAFCRFVKVDSLRRPARSDRTCRIIKTASAKTDEVEQRDDRQ